MLERCMAWWLLDMALLCWTAATPVFMASSHHAPSWEPQGARKARAWQACGMSDAGKRADTLDAWKHADTL